MKLKHPLMALFLAGMLCSMSAAAPAAVVRGEVVSAAEIAALPPVCKLIVIEKPNAHIDRIAQARNAALFDRPEYQMAKNAFHVHHWCRAIIVRQRYFSASTPQKRRGYQFSFHDEMDYVIRNMGPAWPYMPLMHVENGEMYLLGKDYGEAASEALSAIHLNPSFARGHVLLANVYNAMGQKSKALEAATEGLKYNPASGTLKRLYDEAGGAKPYPEPYPQRAPPSQQAAPTEPLPPPASAEFKAAGEEAAVTQPLRLPEDTEPYAVPDAAAPGKPAEPHKYCRFCP